MTRPFTGRHMAAIMVAFFAVVIAVNFYMATQASRTFGGKVVENSYVASQQFNTWLAAARAQEEAGWRIATALGADGIVSARLTLRDAALDGATVTARALHPVGRLPEQTLAFRAAGNGRYVSTTALPAGRWQIRFDVDAQGRPARFEEEVRR